jgi:hypothetical protein
MKFINIDIELILTIVWYNSILLFDISVNNIIMDIIIKFSVIFSMNISFNFLSIVVFLIFLFF